ncbi:MAG TPA: hypothetical protein VJ549_10825, partial [Geothrix sp.]|nr:hypothetical protein [Geothrix sp.]
MVELLMAAFVMSIGLLGLAAMQTITISQALGGRNRGTAVLVAHSVLDSITAQGLASSADRDLSPTATVSTDFDSAILTPSDPTTAGTATLAQQYTILGLLPDDTYYTSGQHPDASTAGVFTVTVQRKAGTLNVPAHLALQQVIVDVAWKES